MVFLSNHLAGLTPGRLILWCYLIWYLVIAARYFEADPKLWATSLGMAVLTGVALTISASLPESAPRRLDKWLVFRFFLIAFYVSSFAALVKGHGFVLIFRPRGWKIWWRWDVA